MVRWDDRQYLAFHEERTRAARELLARVTVEPARAAAPDFRVVDLGCGPGNSTALLAARWPDAKVRGVDSSAEMLARAQKELPALAWELADVSTWTPTEPVDVLFANAVFQWLPAHEQLLPRLLASLRPGGTLAFQVPRNFEEPSHRAMREVRGPWAAAVTAVRDRSPVASPAFYYDLLCQHGSVDARVDVWQTIYEHVMESPAAIVEWVKGTGLRPYLEAVAPALRQEYLAAYEAALAEAYPARRDGRRLFTFPRLFVVATRRD